MFIHCNMLINPQPYTSLTRFKKNAFFEKNYAAPTALQALKVPTIVMPVLDLGFHVFSQ